MPPAMLDATLQLAASLQHTSAPAVLHIPAGIDAYYLAAQSGQVAMWASAAAGSRNVSDHSMFVEGSNVIHLTGLAVKDVWVAHQERPVPRQIDSQMFATNTNYEIVWKATGAGCLITNASYEHHLSTSVVNHCPSRDAATGIQLGQHIVPDLIQTVSLQTVESQGDATKQTVGAETWGVMRCAAPETRGITTFYGCDRDSTTVRAPLSECVQSYGVYGVTLRSCLLYTPDAADELLCVDLGGCRIIKKKIHLRPSRRQVKFISRCTPHLIKHQKYTQHSTHISSYSHTPK